MRRSEIHALSGESTCYHCYSSVRLRPVPVDLKPPELRSRRREILRSGRPFRSFSDTPEALAEIYFGVVARDQTAEKYRP